MKANVYVDGFNFYYGAVKDTAYRWLDLGKLSRFLLSGDGHSVHRIRYFTALIQPRDDPDQPQRQQTYLRALGTIPDLTIHYGTFLTSYPRMALHPVPSSPPKTVQVVKTEEKGSDVNLATHLLLDAFDGDYEIAIVISNDSDLVEPIRAVRQRFGLPVGIYHGPKHYPGSEMGQVGTFQRRIREKILRVCQFPTALQDATGTIGKPMAW